MRLNEDLVQEYDKERDMRASRGEIKIEEILTEAGLNFKMELAFEGLNSSNGRPLRFDFAVFDDDGNLDFLIEYQGRQHYEPSSKFGGKKGFYQQQFNDAKKRRFCQLHDIKLIEIPYTDENLIDYDYIINKAYGK
jgi:hypothetical protein